MKVIIDKKGHWNYWEKGDFSSLFGMIKEKDMKNGIVKSHIGKEFIVFEASFVDKLNKIKRGPAVMTLKDIGIIISNTGINSESKVVEAGAGCGVLSAFLGRICKLTSYENNESHYNIAKKNLEFLKVNVDLKLKDIYSGIDEKDVDVIVLDLLEPWKVSHECLKSGGYFVAYLPNITQVSELVKSKKDLILQKVEEVFEREWIVDGRKVRPKNQMLGHTGFLVFMRKL